MRRKLIHLIRTKQAEAKTLDRLDRLAEVLDYLPLNTETLRRAADLWAEARIGGFPTARESSLDGDVILAPQALEVTGTVVTTNRKHLSRFVAAQDWTEIQAAP